MIVMAGGSARRAGGVDKCLLLIGGRPLLALVLDARLAVGAEHAGHVVVVGPERPGFPDVIWTRELPAGAGPLSAVAAGLAALDAEADPVLVVGGDMPYVARGVPALLAALAAGAHVAALVDSDDETQPLASAWRRTALSATLARLEPLDGLPLRRIFDGVEVALVADVDGASTDVDTLDDLARLVVPE
jgi:molybdopterin-guanine dinucleotide biosynthesis protein A